MGRREHRKSPIGRKTASEAAGTGSCRGRRGGTRYYRTSSARTRLVHQRIHPWKPSSKTPLQSQILGMQADGGLVPVSGYILAFGVAAAR